MGTIINFPIPRTSGEELELHRLKRSVGYWDGLDGNYNVTYSEDPSYNSGFDIGRRKSGHSFDIKPKNNSVDPYFWEKY